MNQLTKHRMILALAVAVLFSLAPFGVSLATITGTCSNCHTMHNSEGGQVAARRINSAHSGLESDTTPNAALLRRDCAGCHSASAAGTWKEQTTGAPIVFNFSNPTNPLAGGNFKYVVDSDSKGHNVTGVANADGNFSSRNIPGSATAYFQVGCAGERGCHGDRSSGKTDVGGMKGAHHSPAPDILDGTSLGRSYRFLKGIAGVEDVYWEYDAKESRGHNVYKGTTTGSTDSISYLCSQCHGNFHTWQGGSLEVGTQSPWLRHPTDAVLKNSGEYAAYTSYNLTAPVARPDPYNGDVQQTLVRPGTDIVMCLSCHRAHGSPNYKMIRWDYKSTSLSTALSGCNVCHTSKN
ncbi:MAG: cytochrome c3 family protein [Pseudomonadota bacterium]